MKSSFAAEPAAIIGFVAAVVVLIAQQLLVSGIVSSEGAISAVGVVVSIVPLIAALIIRQFVSPVAKLEG